MLNRVHALALCFTFAVPAAGTAGQPIHPDGFWKVHPARTVDAEFGGEDPIGLAGHQHIPTDCSIAWKDQSHDKVYCFSSPISSLTFQDDSLKILPQASAFWGATHPGEPDMLAGAGALD